ncbi:MAG: hypothetical protein HXO29_01275 [Prevotella sp.]|nr:hypothetical protein [Prevotella sp.]
MKQNKIKIGYQAPYTEVIVINNETLLADTSMPGQHNPGNHLPGPAALGAKEEVEWLEVGDEALSNNNHTSLWED